FGELLAAERVGRVHDRTGAFVDAGERVVYRVGDKAAVAESADLENPRHRDLARLLGQFELVLPVAVLVFPGPPLVDAAQGRPVVRCRQSSADAPDADGRALLFEVGDEVLIEVIAGEDTCLLEAGFIEHAAGFDAEISEIARIETNTRQLMPAL